jgi:hypothetical protein
MIKLLIIVIFASLSILAQSNESNKQITCLLNLIEKSEAVFIRNGSKHSSLKAREHLEYKYKQATKSSWPFYKKVEVTPEKFIEKIASKSSFSGKAYQIQFGKKIYLTEEWLTKKLNSSCRIQS